MESELVRACLDYLAVRHVFCWRQNTTGVFNPKSGGYFFHGKKGVSDILGLTSKGTFMAIECKSGSGRLSEHQSAFLSEIEANNGIALVVRSLDELHEGLKPYL